MAKVNRQRREPQPVREAKPPVPSEKVCDLCGATFKGSTCPYFSRTSAATMPAVAPQHRNPIRVVPKPAWMIRPRRWTCRYTIGGGDHQKTETIEGTIEYIRNRLLEVFSPDAIVQPWGRGYHVGVMNPRAYGWLRNSPVQEPLATIMPIEKTGRK